MRFLTAKKKLIFIFLLIIVFLFLVIFELLKSALEVKLKDAFKGKGTFKELKIGPGYLIIKDLSFKDTKSKGIGVNISTKEVKVIPDLKDLISRKIHLKKVILKSPEIIIEKKAFLKIYPFWRGLIKKKRHSKKSSVHIDELFIIKGSLTIIDHSFTPFATIKMRSLNITLKNIDYPSGIKRSLLELIGAIPERGAYIFYPFPTSFKNSSSFMIFIL